MARTRQTARRSTGGPAPRFGQCVSASESSESQQVEIFTHTNVRTIAVTGSVDMEVNPDIVRVSFEIAGTGADTDAAMSQAVPRLAKARELATACGIDNQSIFSDSVRINEVVEYEDGASAGRSSFGARDPTKVIKNRYVKVTTVLRISLEGSNVSLFNSLMLAFTDYGLQTYDAPVYDTSMITEYRQQARQDAVLNAKAKAEVLVAALGDSSVTLGSPILIRDIQVDVTSDAESSFNGLGLSFGPTVVQSTGEELSDSEESQAPKVKKPRLDELQKVTGDLFVVPPIIIGAQVKIIFELKTAEQA